jgi:hypothetical protein
MGETEPQVKKAISSSEEVVDTINSRSLLDPADPANPKSCIFDPTNDEPLSCILCN